MKVAVTGGSGVVGSAVVRHLVRAGHDVYALSRSTTAGAHLADLGATLVHGDVLDFASVQTLVDGSEWVFHVAGVNEMCSRDPDRMWRVNVEGTRLVVNASREAGVSRLVHTSSAVTIGEQHGQTGTETTGHRGHYLSNYERSKVEAERLAFTEARGLEVVSVNPSSVQGPGRDTGTGRLVLDAARGRLPFIIDTVISIVDIDDCARGHLLAAERGEAGERYILSGETLSMTEALGLLSEVVGRELPRRTIGGRTLRVLAAVIETAYRLTTQVPPLCREAVRVMEHGHRYDGSRAERELGLVYTQIEDTLRRTVDWLRQSGRLTG